MAVRFLYQDSLLYDKNKETLVIKLVTEVRKHLKLPDDIEVEMVNLGPSSYGQTVLNPKFKQRMKINAILDLKEIVFPVVHELVHLHQIHIGKLMARRDGSIIWEGLLYSPHDQLKMQYKDYYNLPWEKEAAIQQKRLLREILNT